MTDALLGIVLALVLTWVVFVLLLYVNRPPETGLRQMMALTPKVLVLLKNMAVDPILPRTIRLRIWLLVAYLALPLDLVPDFLPVVGYADDVILTLLVLRSVLRRAGQTYVNGRWTGSPDELDVLLRLCRVAD